MNDTGLNSSVANTSLDDTESCRACRDGAGGVDADICRGFARDGMAHELSAKTRLVHVTRKLRIKTTSSLERYAIASVARGLLTHVPHQRNVISFE